MHRPGSARPIAVATWATCSVLAGGLLLGGAYGSVATYAVLAGLAAVAAVAYAAFWRPSVEIAPHGVELRNPLRQVLITWPALTEVDGRFGLRLRTGDTRWSAWAAAPPTVRERRMTGESEIAGAVRAAWESVRGAGHLGHGPNGPREVAPPQVTWRWPAALLVGVPTAACLVLGLLA